MTITTPEELDALPGCRNCGGAQVYARFLCRNCYKRAMRAGNAPERMRIHDPIKRLSLYVTRGPDGGCWPWVGTLDRAGYGRSWVSPCGAASNGSNRQACCWPRSRWPHLGPVPGGDPMTALTKLTIGLTAVVLAVTIWIAGSLWALWVGAVEAAAWWLGVVAG